MTAREREAAEIKRALDLAWDRYGDGLDEARRWQRDERRRWAGGAR